MNASTGSTCPWNFLLLYPMSYRWCALVPDAAHNSRSCPSQMNLCHALFLHTLTKREAPATPPKPSPSERPAARRGYSERTTAQKGTPSTCLANPTGLSRVQPNPQQSEAYIILLLHRRIHTTTEAVFFHEKKKKITTRQLLHRKFSRQLILASCV